MSRERVVFRGARVFDPARGLFEPRELWVEEGHVVAPGARAGARTVDLDGRWVLPGLIDAHMHLQWLGATLRIVDLAGARDEREAVARVATRAATLPPGTWIEGQGWDETRWGPAALPTRALLDAAVPVHPVALKRVDHHAVWANGAALSRAGVDRSTREPEGGRLLRDARGEPTGVLVDNAAELVWRCVPSPDAAQLRDDLARGMARMASRGFTCVHDMMLTPAMLAALEALEREGALPLRVRGYLYGPWEQLAPLLGRARHGRLRVCGVKFFSDGTLGSRTAALAAPYRDAPDSRGLLVHEAGALERAVEGVQRAGFPVAIHAIGDRANALALAAIAPSRHPLSRVEHAQVVSDELVRAFAAARLTASMQPVHWADDAPWAAQRLGPERLRFAYAWGRLAAAGVPLAFGSDAPIASEDPWRGLRAVLEREDAAQRLELPAALRAYTLGGARAAGDMDLGHLAPGARADFTVLDADPLVLLRGEAPAAVAYVDGACASPP